MRCLGCIVAFILVCGFARGQSVGLAFSYFIPRDGEFSTPISPFSLRGVGVDLNRYVALETGISLYRMAGLNLTDIPFTSHKSLTGPNFTVFVPANIVLQFKGAKAEFDLKGGGFFFYAFDQRLNYGNLDRALATYQGWDVANSSFNFENSPGVGFMAGFEFSFDVTNQWGLSFEVNYLAGTSRLPLDGSVTGGLLNGTLSTTQLAFKDAKVDFTGLEFSIGINFNTGQRR